MSDEGVDTSMFEEFLSKNRIDMKSTNQQVSSPASNSKYSEEELESMAILNARVNRYPMTVEDVYHNKVQNISNLVEVYTKNCYAKCAVATHAPFMTTGEGLCFRNCITKFNAWYPSLKQNLNDAPFRFYEEMTHDHLMANNAEYNALNQDPWAEQGAELEAHMNSKPMSI